MLIERNPGQIEAQDAHIWWNDRLGVGRVVPLDPALTARLTREGYNYGTGASFSRWKDATDAERVREMTEVAIKLMVDGYDPAMVVREFSKVRQFLELGAESFVMCRALTKVSRAAPTRTPSSSAPASSRPAEPGPAQRSRKASARSFSTGLTR